MSFKYYEDPILGKGRAQVTGGTGGGGGTKYVGGNRISIAGGTISFVNSADIVNVTGTSVTLQPDTAYKIYATSQAITLNANPPAAGKWAYEGHLEIFTAGTGYIVTGTNVVLANALEPDAVNNCTVRFHDGIAIIAVEDHVAGYIVVNGSTSGDGSLYYGITTSTNDYVAFDASLNGQTIPLAGAVAEGEKHLVGNGYTETTLTGAVDCGTSKFTVANLSLSDVQVTGGVMTFGDAFIPSGSTVAVSGGGLAVEKVTGNGGVIDLGGTNCVMDNLATVSVTGCTVKGGYATSGGGAFNCTNSYAAFSNCYIIDNVISSGFGGGINVAGYNHTASASFVGCVVSGNSSILADRLADIRAVYSSSIVKFENGNTIGTLILQNNASATIEGTNRFDSIGYISTYGSGSVTISSGAILDLTGNTNATPIAPGGGITFEQGGATVLYDHDSNGSAMASSASYMMDNVTLPAGAKLTNTAVVDLNNTHITPANRTDFSASGVVFSGGSASTYGGVFSVTGGTVHISACTFSDNKTVSWGGGGALAVYYGAKVYLTDCLFSGNTAADGRAIYAGTSSPEIFITGCTFGANQDIKIRPGSGDGANIYFGGSNVFSSVIAKYSTTSGTVTFSSGAILDLTGNTNETPINPGGGITFEPGGSKMIRYGSGTSSGTRVFEDVEIRGSSISNQGIIYGATVYFPESHGPLDVWYTTDSGTTSSSVQISGGTPTFVVDGGLVSVES